MTDMPRDDVKFIETLVGMSDSEFAVVASGELCEDFKAKIDRVIGRQNDIIQSLRSAQQWRGIESAPRDGTFVLVFVSWRWGGGTGLPAQLIDVAHFDVGVMDWVFVTPANYHQRKAPRHKIEYWMPLPAAPLPATGADQ